MFDEEKLNNEDEPRVNVAELSAEQKQRGIDANLAAMVESFVGHLSVLESVVRRKVDVKVKAKLVDGRTLHIRIK